MLVGIDQRAARIVSSPTWGQASRGIATGGALDAFSLACANRLLGQADHTPALECQLRRQNITTTVATTAVITGAPCSAELDGEPIPHGCVFEWPANTTLTLTPPVHGARWYLAVPGGLRLDDRDTFCITTPRAAEARVGKRRPPLTKLFAWAPRNGHLRWQPGPDWNRLQDNFPSGPWQVTPTSNAMGVRLSGATYTVDSDNLTSGPVCPGIIQATPNGLIILLRDCQTIGGYPRIGRLLASDLDRAAQLRPYHVVHLDLVSPAEANAAQAAQSAALDLFDP